MNYKTMKYKNEKSDEMWKSLYGTKFPENNSQFYVYLFDPIFDLGFDYAMKMKGDKTMKKSTAKKAVKKTTTKKVAKKKTK